MCASQAFLLAKERLCCASGLFLSMGRVLGKGKASLKKRCRETMESAARPFSAKSRELGNK